jgi:hypothetical protein
MNTRTLEQKVDALERKVDQLPTHADLSKFATKDDLVVFKDEIIKSVRILSEDVKDTVKKAAEGYGATLERIERDLGDLNRKVDDNHADHSVVLANHGTRLTRLERSRRRP